MIDCTIIINLSRHENRKNDMTKKLESVKINKYIFHNAVDGNSDLSNYNFKILPYWKDYFKKRTITVGEIGCAFSHYNVWKYIVDNNISKTLILEDDVIFKNNFDYYINKIQTVDFYYDILFLGRTPLINTNCEQKVNDFIVKPKSSNNAHAYIISYECANKLLNTDYLNNLLPVDDFLSIMYDNNYPFKEYSKFFKHFEKIEAYSLINEIVQQNTSYYGSSIDNSKLYNPIIKDNFKNISCNIVVIDDFYEKPYEVREFALQCKTGYTSRDYHPGVRTESYATETHQDFFNKLVEPFYGKIVNFNCSNDDNSNGAFQLNTANDVKSWIHSDLGGSNFAGIVYLTPNPPLSSGTGFFKLKSTNECEKNQNEKNNKLCRDGYDNSLWEKVSSIGNVFNRLILFRSDQYHISLDYFGKDFDDGRLIQLFFFKTEH